MIKSLDISNYALIEALHIEFTQGLNIITGETGAGKSILLGALGLIMGKRADKKALYSDSAKCIIEAEFDVRYRDLSKLYLENDIDEEDVLTIRRIINPNGKSRSYVNDSPVRLGVLSDFTDVLVDLHQQFDTLQLHSASFQLNVIDALAGNADILSKYKNKYKVLISKKAELSDLKEALSKSLKEREYYQFLETELDDAGFTSNEQIELEKLQTILANAEEIKLISHMVSSFLSENENAMVGQTQDMIKQMSSLCRVDSRFENMSNRLESVLEEIKDIAVEASDIFENTEYNDAEVTRVDDRLNLMYKLFKKHNVPDLEELAKIHMSISDKLLTTQMTNEAIVKLEKEIKISNEGLVKSAETISKRRQKLAPKFEQDIKLIMSLLAMPNAELSVDIKPLEEININGIDRLSYLFRANKGGSLNPIKNVASGGEISRLTLAVKSIVASALQLPTMIFDEIDTGLSGAVANKMGEILLDLAKDHQVISITHSPQIASKANNHFFVYKDEKGNRTKSAIKILNKEERVLEIAKMLSGDKLSEASMQNAREMLEA